MNLPAIFMFSGQGAQYYQMGKELFDTNPIFRNCMHQLDKTAIDQIETSVVSVLYDEKKRMSDTFSRTLYTHPAIFMVQYSLAQVLMAEGIVPDYLLGASMGEFASAALAGVMSPEDVLAVVIKQAQALEMKCPPGGMTTILSDPAIFNKTPLLRQETEFVGRNFDNHFVISGKNDALRRVEEFLKNQEIVHMSLPVSQAFHSAWIDPAKEMINDFLKQQTIQQPKIPMISCVGADEISVLKTGHFWDIIQEPIAFQKTIQHLEKQQHYLYIDVGPSGTLSNFVKYNISDHSGSKIFSFLTPFRVMYSFS